MNRKEALSVLGVSRGASESDIKEAYRDLVREYHPDHCDAPDAQEKFMKIKEAKTTLDNTSEAAAKNSKTAKSGSSQSQRTANTSRTSTDRSSSSTTDSTSQRQNRTTHTNRTTSTSGSTNRKSQRSSSSDRSWREKKAEWENKTKRATSSDTQERSSRTSTDRNSSSTTDSTSQRQNRTTHTNRTTSTSGSTNRKSQRSSSSDRSWRENKAEWENKTKRATSSDTQERSSRTTTQTSSSSTSTNLGEYLKWRGFKSTLRRATNRIREKRSGGWINPDSLKTDQPEGRNPLAKFLIFYMLCVTHAFRPDETHQLKHTRVNFFVDLLSISISVPDKLHSIGKNTFRKYAIFSVGIGVGLTTSIGIVSDYTSWGSLASIAFGGAFIAASLNILIQDRHSSLVPSLERIVEYKLNCWSPLGSLLILAVFGGFYTFAQAFSEYLFIPSIRMFPILLLYSIPAIAGLTYLLKNTEVLPHSGFKSRFPNSIPIGLGMVTTGLIVHLPFFEPIMPGYFIGLDSMYYGNGSVELEAMIVSLISASWLCLLIPTIDAVETGWNRVHQDWRNNPAIRIIATGTITGAMAVILWTLLPGTPLPENPISVFEYLVLALGVYTYVYGIITTPNKAPNWS